MAGQRGTKKGSKAAAPAAAASTSASTTSDAHDHQEPIKVNLYEPGALKHALDDVVRCVVLDAGYEEDMWISNIKTGTGVAAIGVALYAQFGPGKFPATWWPVFLCVLAYVVLTLFLNWFCSHYEGEAFLVTSKASRGLCVASRMARWSEDYSLVIEQREHANRSLSRNFSVASFFHADGHLAEDAWRGEVEALLAEYEATHLAPGAGSTAGSGHGSKKND